MTDINQFLWTYPTGLKRNKLCGVADPAIRLFIDELCCMP